MDYISKFKKMKDAQLGFNSAILDVIVYLIILGASLKLGHPLIGVGIVVFVVIGDLVISYRLGKFLDGQMGKVTIWTHCSWCMVRQTFFWVSGRTYECEICHHQKELPITNPEPVINFGTESQASRDQDEEDNSISYSICSKLWNSIFDNGREILESTVWTLHICSTILLGKLRLSRTNQARRIRPRLSQVIIYQETLIS